LHTFNVETIRDPGSSGMYFVFPPTQDGLPR